MNVYKIEIDGCGNENMVEHYELTEEDFFPPEDGRFGSFSMYFGDDCESYWEYAEWFWDFYGSDVYDNCDDMYEDRCEYKVCGYVF